MLTAARRQIPDVIGRVIDVPAKDRLWYDVPLRMQVTEVRTDLRSQALDETQVWIGGFQINDQGEPEQRWDELVDVEVLTGLSTEQRPRRRGVGPTID